MGKFGSYDNAAAIDGSEVLVVKQGAETVQTTVAEIGGSAEATAFTPAGNIGATNVQDALEELDNELISTLDLGTDVIMSGLFAARPAAGVAGRFYLATDKNGGTLYRDSGAAWVQAAGHVAQYPTLPASSWFDGNYTKAASSAAVQNVACYTPFDGLRVGQMIDALGVDIVTGGASGATAILSLFADDGSGKPGALLAQTSALAVETNSSWVSGTFTAVAVTTSIIHVAYHSLTSQQASPRTVTINPRYTPTGASSTTNVYVWTTTSASTLASNPTVSNSSGGSVKFYRLGFRAA